jgi:hypothetical protein
MYVTNGHGLAAAASHHEDVARDRVDTTHRSPTRGS